MQTPLEIPVCSLHHLASQVGECFVTNNGWVGTAESCTGGLVASVLTDIPGSSRYVRGGIVAYDNAIKEYLLGVTSVTLQQFGAVSPQVAQAMAVGALRELDVDCSVALTGIAGPSADGTDKPVGLLYLATARQPTFLPHHRDTLRVYNVLAEDPQLTRLQRKELFTKAALAALLKWFE
jgi:nicotinamide-nucleotide amidase